MKALRKLAFGTAALALTAGSAAAGGVQWLSPSAGVGLLFEKGKHVEFSLGSVSPNVSGTAIAAAGGRNSGNMVKNYMPFSLGIKVPLGKGFDFAFWAGTPVGAKVSYPAGTGYPYAGSTATITSHEYKALLRYKMPSNVSVYGGLRMDEAKGEAHVIAPGIGLDYTLSTRKDSSAGWLAGVAYEKPDIALRVALTYSSPITHTFDSTESITGTPYQNVPSQFKTTMPKSWTLDFQTGVAPKTLLFGSVEWRQWKAFDISPMVYTAATKSALVSYDNNTVTWNLGLGRQFTDTLSGAVSFGYEKSNGGFAGNLGPTDGFKSLSLALIYTKDNMKITTGVSYAKIGNAQTENPLAPGTALSNFTGNHAMGVGVKVGYSF